MAIYNIMVYLTCLANLGFSLPLEGWLLQRARKKETYTKLEIPTTLAMKCAGLQKFS